MRVYVVKNVLLLSILDVDVAFTESERLIGESAKNQAAMNPKNTIFDAKRLIGRLFSDVSVQKDMKLWPFRVCDLAGRPMIEVEHKVFFLFFFFVFGP